MPEAKGELMNRFGVFLAAVILIPVLAAAQARASFWPGNYGWRVESMGGAYLAIEDETTEINLLNLKNPAGLAFLEYANRLDFLVGAEQQSDLDGTTQNKKIFLDGNGEYSALILWFNEKSVLQLWPLRAAYRLLPELAVSTLVGGSVSTSGRASLSIDLSAGWKKPDLLFEGSTTTLGLNGGRTGDDPLLNYVTAGGVNNEGPATFVSIQAVNNHPNWTYGLLADYRHVESSPAGGDKITRDLLGFAPLVRGRVALAPDADLLLGLNYSTLGSGQESRTFAGGNSPAANGILRQEVAFGAGFQLFQQRLQLALQGGYSSEHHDRDLAVTGLKMNGGLEFRPGEAWALRGGAAFVRNVYASASDNTDEYTATLGLGCRPTWELSLDLMGKYVFTNYRASQAHEDQQEISVALGVTVRLEP